MTKQILKIQKDAIARYKRIADLWVSYYVHGEDPLEFGREFYQAVGNLLEGNPISKLILHHISVEDVQNVVFIGRPKSEDEGSEAEQSVGQHSSVAGCKSESESKNRRTRSNREKREGRERSTKTTKRR